MFWGMTLYPGVEYTRDVTRQEYLTLASLDCRPQMNRGETNLTAYLVLKCDSYEHVLCSLVQGRAHQQILNFVLQEGEKMTLTVEGSGIVHVTGYTLKHPALSDDIDTRTETTSMREVSDGIQDGEVLSPHPSSVGDDSIITDEDIISEVKLENRNRCDVEPVNTERGSYQSFMDENTLPPDVVRDGTISNDTGTAPEGTIMDSNGTLCATPESSVTSMTTSDHRWLSRENPITSNNLMQDTCNYALNIKEETEQVSYQHVNCKTAVLRSNQREGALDPDVSTPATSEPSTLNRGTNIHRQPSRGDTVSNSNIMENATNYTSFFEVKQEQASDHHLTSMHAIFTSNGTVGSDESTHETAELSAMNMDTTNCRGPNREDTVCTNDVMGKTTDYTPRFEVKRKQASDQHLTSTNGIMTSNGTLGAIESDKSTNERTESSIINMDINDYKGPNREDTVPTDTVIENITDYTSEYEEEREPASEQHLTNTNGIMNSNETEGSVDSDESIHATAESSATGLDTNDISWPNKKVTIPADSVMENITDYDTSDFEEEKEHASGQHLTSTNAIMNSNEIEGGVDSDKSTPATAESSTIHTDTLAFKGPNQEGAVPADSVMENITDCTSDFEEEREQVLGRVVTTTNVIVSSNEGDSTANPNKCTYATTDSSASEMATNYNSQSPDDKGERASMQQTFSAETKLEGSNDSITQGTVSYHKKECLQTSCNLCGKNVNSAVNSEAVENGDVLLDRGTHQPRWKTKRCFVLLERIDKFFNNYADSHSDGTSFLLQFSGKKVTVKDDSTANDRNHIVKQAITRQSSVRMCYGRTLFKCQVCPKTFSTMESLSRHNNIHINEKFFESYGSHEKFIHKAKLKTLERIPTGQNNYKRSLYLKKFNHRTNISLKKMHTCKHCGKKFRAKAYLYQHEKTHTGEKPHTCKYCNEKFLWRSTLQTHERKHTGEKTITCEYCNEKFSNNLDLRAHKKIHNGEKHFTCKCCDKKFCRKHDLKRHARIHTGEKPYSCKYCDEKFCLRRTLQIHESKHTGKIMIPCEYCNKEFSHKPDLWEHKKIHKGENLFACKCCDKKFRKKSYLKIHARIHTGEKPFKCNYCSKTFRQRGTRKIHERIHTRENTFSCRYCEKEFRQKEDLTEHEKDHTGELPYTCKHCDRKYRTKCSLSQHEIIHTGKKPFKCDHCDMKFYQKARLIRHKRIHTGEKPFACKFCNKKFNQKSYLNRHERIHTDEKPFSCKHCDKKFRWRNTLVIHESVHTDVNRSRREHYDNENITSDGKPFTCGYCYKRFSHLEHLTEHERDLCTEKPFTCEYCNKKFIHKGSLQMHERIHTDTEASTSENCNEKLNQKDQLQLHEISHAGEKLFTFEHCNEKFSQKDYLQEHERVHKGEKPFACKHCDKKFSQKDHFQLHERSHAGEKLLTCEHCYEKFTQKDYLQEHEKVHNVEKPFTCKHCNETFSQKEYLQDHERVHNGKKPFICEHCDKEFSQKDHLQLHEKSHTGEKLFTCEHCKEKFSQKSYLQVHEKVHNVEKPLTCKHCNEKFNQKEYLKMHERVHTGEEHFTCKHCSKKFSQESVLKLHERIHAWEKPFKCKHCYRKFSQKVSLEMHESCHTGAKPSTCKE